MNDVGARRPVIVEKLDRGVAVGAPQAPVAKAVRVKARTEQLASGTAVLATHRALEGTPLMTVHGVSPSLYPGGLLRAVNRSHHSSECDVTGIGFFGGGGFLAFQRCVGQTGPRPPRPLSTCRPSRCDPQCSDHTATSGSGRAASGSRGRLGNWRFLPSQRTAERRLWVARVIGSCCAS